MYIIDKNSAYLYQWNLFKIVLKLVIFFEINIKKFKLLNLMI